MKNILLICAAAIIFLAACDASKKSTNVESPFIEGRVLVLLENGIGKKKIENDFAEYNAVASGPISRSQNRWMVDFDGASKSTEEFRELLLSKSYVLEAELAPKQ